ncbi:uncharacterized protein THITE_2121887 [Thermothielavioides terrestris NRRL 8126]|uniref:Uncharacterized protein n=1 Tax=Thermothielavioides terrestris (strain ATCC 38088 / NRRL 8126) TaxID=578455 RepID=G2RFF5_THETT|nr:uncharacterized protein THITE_2121887 [Thermothielavioides terrestris NRRL 8126]AEO70438.1 hypothetical protein THITE_2121887 [Thermothielavioides terrestris NRRL 8126]
MLLGDAWLPHPPPPLAFPPGLGGNPPTEDIAADCVVVRLSPACGLPPVTGINRPRSLLWPPSFDSQPSGAARTPLGV